VSPQTNDSGTRVAVLRAYYDTVIKSHSTFSFLSPVHLSWWLDDATTWMRCGSSVAEIGVGMGELALSVLSAKSNIGAYYAVDISGEMLRNLRELVASLGYRDAEIRYLEMNIEDRSFAESIGAESLDRIIAVNVFQDVRLMAALQEIAAALRPGGLLRATIIRRETHDEFWSGEDYDAKNGRLYTLSRIHDRIGAQALGTIIKDGQQRSFYRVQQFYSEKEITALAAAAGFEVLSTAIVIFPIELVKSRWSSALHRTFLSRKQELLLEKWGGFPDSYDFIMRRPA
jgi:SAM-dependent methyltransferase